MTEPTSLFPAPTAPPAAGTPAAVRSPAPKRPAKKAVGHTPSLRRTVSRNSPRPICNFEEVSLFPDSADPAPLRPPAKKTPAKSPRRVAKNWSPPTDFRIHAPSEPESPEFYRVRRKAPYPEMLDELLVRLIPHLPPFPCEKTLCTGTVFPAAAAVCASRSSASIYFCEDESAREKTRQLSPAVLCVDNESEAMEEGGFSLIVACQDSPVGRSLSEKILSLSKCLARGGLLVFAAPAEHLLDYTTNVRNEAPMMRDRVHRTCRTHFILRPTGPLMNPAWDVLVLGRRPPSEAPPKNKWRITGTGFLPWQKCNEAVSSAPWLLVESYDQIAPAIARCINYPWEKFEPPKSGS